MAINLHHSTMGPEPASTRSSFPPPTVVLIHGLFGMGNNLGALARALKNDFYVYSLDLPNHGRSDWLAHADIPAMAECVRGWMAELNLEHAHFFGHSLGGKVAMELALQHPERVDSLSIADIAPVQYPPRHDNVLAALRAVADSQCQSRAAAGEIMAGFLEEESLIQFLLMSIRRDEHGVYKWRFNLAEIIESYGAIRAGLESETPYTLATLFIKGGDSDYILPEHRDTILRLFPRAKVKVMPDCGHWLHAQKPQLFNSIVLRFLTDGEN